MLLCSLARPILPILLPQLPEVFLLFNFVFEFGFYIAQAGLELARYLKMTSNSTSSWFYFPRAGITHV